MSTTTSATVSATSADVSAGTAPVRMVAGTNRVQAQVNGQWYDLTGIAKAQLLNGDRRYAATVTFSAIGSISADAAGAAPTGIDGSLVLGFGKQSTAPVRTFSAAPEPVAAPASTIVQQPTTVATFSRGWHV